MDEWVVLSDSDGDSVKLLDDSDVGSDNDGEGSFAVVHVRGRSVERSDSDAPALPQMIAAEAVPQPSPSPPGFFEAASYREVFSGVAASKHDAASSHAPELDAADESSALVDDNDTAKAISYVDGDLQEFVAGDKKGDVASSYDKDDIAEECSHANNLDAPPVIVGGEHENAEISDVAESNHVDTKITAKDTSFFGEEEESDCEEDIECFDEDDRICEANPDDEIFDDDDTESFDDEECYCEFECYCGEDSGSSEEDSDSEDSDEESDCEENSDDDEIDEEEEEEEESISEVNLDKLMDFAHGFEEEDLDDEILDDDDIECFDEEDRSCERNPADEIFDDDDTESFEEESDCEEENAASSGGTSDDIDTESSDEESDDDEETDSEEQRDAEEEHPEMEFGGEEQSEAEQEHSVLAGITYCDIDAEISGEDERTEFNGVSSYNDIDNESFHEEENICDEQSDDEDEHSEFAGVTYDDIDTEFSDKVIDGEEQSEFSGGGYDGIDHESLNEESYCEEQIDVEEYPVLDRVTYDDIDADKEHLKFAAGGDIDTESFDGEESDCQDYSDYDLLDFVHDMLDDYDTESCDEECVCDCCMDNIYGEDSDEFTGEEHDDVMNTATRAEAMNAAMRARTTGNSEAGITQYDGSEVYSHDEHDEVDGADEESSDDVESDYGIAQEASEHGDGTGGASGAGVEHRGRTLARRYRQTLHAYAAAVAESASMPAAQLPSAMEAQHARAAESMVRAADAIHSYLQAAAGAVELAAQDMEALSQGATSLRAMAAAPRFAGQAGVGASNAAAAAASVRRERARARHDSLALQDMVVALLAFYLFFGLLNLFLRIGFGICHLLFRR